MLEWAVGLMAIQTLRMQVRRVKPHVEEVVKVLREVRSPVRIGINVRAHAFQGVGIDLARPIIDELVNVL